MILNLTLQIVAGEEKLTEATNKWAHVKVENLASSTATVTIQLYGTSKDDLNGTSITRSSVSVTPGTTLVFEGTADHKTTVADALNCGVIALDNIQLIGEAE